MLDLRVVKKKWSLVFKIYQENVTRKNEEVLHKELETQFWKRKLLILEIQTSNVKAVAFWLYLGVLPT